MSKIGIIGGSGLNKIDILKESRSKKVKTSYGAPSSPLICGVIDGVEVVIIARHGPNHELPPSKVPFRANIAALKEEGVSHILAATAVGSLRQEIAPGNLVFPSQFIDYTRGREMTFHDSDVVHCPMSDPFDTSLRDLLCSCCDELSFRYNREKTVITIEGPRFSSRAESTMFRLWGADIINMSTCPEVILANELGIPYQTIAMSTDYDCWKLDEPPVTYEIVMKRMSENARKVQTLLVTAIRKLKGLR